MNFLKLSQEKNKIFIVIVAAFLFLSSFMVFESFLKTHILTYLIWLIFYFPIMLFSGVIYGILTKSRIRSIILGFSFPLIFVILKLSFDTSSVIITEDTITFITFMSFSHFVPFINAIACCFASTAEENKGKRNVQYFLSLICMAFSAVFMAIDFRTIIYHSFIF
jgi:hypothetical protein